MNNLVPIEDQREARSRLDIVRPLVSLDAAVQAFNEYQKLKQKLAGPGDFAKFKDREGREREAPTKQWRCKLTRFFGISVDIVREEVKTLPDGSFVVEVTAKATAPNGLYMYGDGSCWSKTKEGGKGDLYHNTRAHAITRAKNRAVLELVGFGEVSAEEIGESEVHEGKPEKEANGTLTEQQLKAILSISKSKGVDYHPIIKERWGLSSAKELSKQQASELIDYLQKGAPAGA